MSHEKEVIDNYLSFRIRPGFECTAEELVINYGRPFAAAKLPRGFRRMMRKQCFRNSFILASEERANYCEGFVWPKGSGVGAVFHHAWVSVDGSTAIDPTLIEPEKHLYFGVQFSYESFCRLAIAGYGKYGFLNPPLDKDLLFELIKADQQKAAIERSQPKCEVIHLADL